MKVGIVIDVGEIISKEFILPRSVSNIKMEGLEIFNPVKLASFKILRSSSTDLMNSLIIHYDGEVDAH